MVGSHAVLLLPDAAAATAAEQKQKQTQRHRHKHRHQHGHAHVHAHAHTHAPLCPALRGMAGTAGCTPTRPGAGCCLVLVWCLVFALCPCQPAVAHRPHDVAGAVAASRDGAMVFAVVRNILYRSADGGFNWEQANYQGLSQVLAEDRWKPSLRLRQPATELHLSPAFDRDGTLYVCDAKEGVFRSTDRGASWRVVALPSGAGFVPASTARKARAAALALSPAFSTDRTVYLAITSELLPGHRADQGAAGTIWRSRDGGGSFARVWPPASLAGSALFSGRSPMCTALLATADVVLAGTDAGVLLGSLDGGTTWQAVAILPGACCCDSSDCDPGSAVTSVVGLSWNASAAPEEAHRGHTMRVVVVANSRGMFRVTFSCSTSGQAGGRITTVATDPLAPAGKHGPAVWSMASAPPQAPLQLRTLFSIPHASPVLLRSRDGGTTWAELGGPHGVMMDPRAAAGFQAVPLNGVSSCGDKPGLLFLATFAGVFKSEQRGL